MLGCIKDPLTKAVMEDFLEAVRVVLRDTHDLVIKQVENSGFIAQMFGSDDMHLCANALVQSG